MIGRNSISDRGITKRTMVKEEEDNDGEMKKPTESPRCSTKKKTKKTRRPSKGLGKRSLGLDFTPGPWDGKYYGEGARFLSQCNSHLFISY